MDLDLLHQIEDLEAVIFTLCVVIVGLCCYVVRMPEPVTAPKFVDPTCPLHKTPRSKCSPESHEDK
jgi:hypothetical protein